jgi:hypothetical protein
MMKRQFDDSKEDNRTKKSKPTYARKDFVAEFKQKQTIWYRVYWLDEFTTRDPIVEYGIDQLKLRGIIDYLETYTTLNKFMEEIERCRIIDEQIIIIITASNTLDLIHKVHELSQIHSIFIYTSSTDENSTIDNNVLNAYIKVSRFYFSSNRSV